MTIQMHLGDKVFGLIKNGAKTIEARVNDPKRQTIKIGDTIEFINNQTDERLRAEIVDLFKFMTFAELFANQPAEDFGGKDQAELNATIYKYYSKEEETKYGVVGIKIALK